MKSEEEASIRLQIVMALLGARAGLGLVVSMDDILPEADKIAHFVLCGALPSAPANRAE